MEQPLGSRYLLHELLGRGAMGQVFRGTVRGSGAPVAVKVLKPELVSDSEVVARFFQERSILTSIDHPNVAKVLDLVVEGDTLGIVMELVEGQDLRRYLRARGTLPPGEAVRLVCLLLQGLAAVHAAGVVHRDVKPENVLVSTTRGQMGLKLTDFGVSRLTYGASLTNVTSLIGTPQYMAPELALHDRATPAVDLYSAGIVLYEMLAGRTPFAGGHPLAVLRRQVEQLPPPVPGAPAELWEQIESLLAKDPQSRPGSAAAALGRLAPLHNRLDGLPALPPMPDQLAPTPGQTMPGREPGRTTAGPEPGQAVLRAGDQGLAPTEGTEPPPIVSGRGRARAQRWRKTAIVALPVALAILGAAVGLLLTRSPHTAPPASDSPASDSPVTATRDASLRGQPTPAKTATRSAPSHTPTAQAVRQVASPAHRSAPSSTPQASPARGSAVADWVQTNGTSNGCTGSCPNSPPALGNYSMTYDAANKTVVVFGGSMGSAYYNATWVWNGETSTWTQEIQPGCATSCPNSPPARGWAASMAYDSATGTVILFGGGGPTGDLNDTWSWNGTTWTQLDGSSNGCTSACPNSPSPRQFAPMAFDPSSNQLLLFGGGTKACDVNLGDTWAWNGTAWNQLYPTSSPSARTQAAMATDPAANGILLFGGATSGCIAGALAGESGFLSDTWLWNGSTWVQKSVSGVIPPARSTAGLGYDSALGQMLLFGGAGSTANFNDTWLWNGSSWTQQSPATAPEGRWGVNLAYDPVAGSAVLFGGDGNGLVNDTWLYKSP